MWVYVFLSSPLLNYMVTEGRGQVSHTFLLHLLFLPDAFTETVLQTGYHVEARHDQRCVALPRAPF